MNANNSSPIAKLSPGYFALVMATGIVSLALHDQGFAAIALTLLAVNTIAFGYLWVLTLIRLFRFRSCLLYDLYDHHRNPGFLTTVAATCVLGSQFAILLSSIDLAFFFWLLGFALWCVLNYAFFAIITMREPKPSLENSINGAWLLTVVATESLAVLGALIAPSIPQKDAILFISLVAALSGAVIYLCMITLILYRWIFFPITPEKLTPDYWINMGALAITTLAGATLLQASSSSHFLQMLHPFLAGFTLSAWAFATWWIPLLFLAGIWKHIFHKAPLNYDPNFWAMVFPLGMYAAATHSMAHILDLKYLFPVSFLFSLVAGIAWLVVFAKMLFYFKISSIASR